MLRSPSGLVTDAMLPPTLKRNLRAASVASVSGDLENQVHPHQSRAVRRRGFRARSPCPSAMPSSRWQKV